MLSISSKLALDGVCAPTYDDISHYRKIIVILIKMHNLMQELGKKA